MTAPADRDRQTSDPALAVPRLRPVTTPPSFPARWRIRPRSPRSRPRSAMFEQVVENPEQHSSSVARLQPAAGSSVNIDQLRARPGQRAVSRLTLVVAGHGEVFVQRALRPGGRRRSTPPWPTASEAAGREHSCRRSAGLRDDPGPRGRCPAASSPSPIAHRWRIARGIAQTPDADAQREAAPALVHRERQHHEAGIVDRRRAVDVIEHRRRVEAERPPHRR